MTVSVECYSGYRAEEEPRRFEQGGRWSEIAAILERWQTPDQRAFRIRTTAGENCVLLQETETGIWRLQPAGKPAR